MTAMVVGIRQAIDLTPNQYLTNCVTKILIKKSGYGIRFAGYGRADMESAHRVVISRIPFLIRY